MNSRSRRITLSDMIDRLLHFIHDTEFSGYRFFMQCLGDWENLKFLVMDIYFDNLKV